MEYRGYLISTTVVIPAGRRRPASYDGQARKIGSKAAMPDFITMGALSEANAAIVLQNFINREYVEEAGQKLYEAAVEARAIFPDAADWLDEAIAFWEAEARLPFTTWPEGEEE